MAISSASGFSIGSSDAIDDRLVLTKAQMKSANDNVFPDVYMCVCSDDGNIYTYNKTNEIDETTGKFRIFESGGGLPEPESKDKLLLSSENETTSELEWKQVDKSEVGSTEWTGTKAEWEALTDEEKAKYVIVNLTNDNGLSHKNLLTNSFFRINTKGLKVYDCSSVTFPFYTVNRWKIFDYGKVDVNNNGITLSNKLTAKGYIASPYIRQYFDDNIENYLGKTITVTLIFNDTEKYQKTYTFPTEKPTENTFFIQERIAENVDFILFVREKEGENINHPLVQIQIQNEILTSIKLNQIKIEFGEESTISEDTFDIENYALCDNSIYDESEGQGVSNIVTFTTVSDFKAFANLMTKPAMYLINIPVGSSELSLFLTKDVTASSLSGILTVKKGVTYGEINVDLFLYEGNMRMFASRYNPETETIINLKIVDNSYSTSETVCGTWIDGKTIYRKVVTLTLDKTKSANINHNITNLDTFVNIQGLVKDTSTGYWFPIGENSANVMTYISVKSDHVHYEANPNDTTYAQNGTLMIILEYTKNDTE